MFQKVQIIDLNDYQYIFNNNLAIEISNSVVTKRNYYNYGDWFCYNMKEVIVKRKKYLL